MIYFPFSAIVGMEQSKKSLIYHAIDPRIGGTLLLGHRGCAKSTLVRAFAEILVAPFVEVPLGTTEDRLLGSVDAGVLVEQNRWQGKTGLIEAAHNGVLYIDEINLLPDHLADLILDSAASGQYRMERDGITRSVESRYILIGTMNPEEGDLRPQLSDRFAHGVQIQDDYTAADRMEIVQRRMLFDDDPPGFVQGYAKEITVLQEKIRDARGRLRNVVMSEDRRRGVAERGRELNLEGIRAELAVVRTARCAAAWAGRDEITDDDIAEAWELCLGHRKTHQPPPVSSPPQNSSPAGNRFTSRTDTPVTPRDSHRAEITLPVPKLSVSLPEWDVEIDAGDSQHGGYSATKKGAIAWIPSLLASVLKGWRKGSFCLKYHRPVRRKTIWCFLDASRSTGANRFLASARDSLMGLARVAKTARYYLLVLRDSQIRWVVRNRGAKYFENVLANLKSAGGKSLIVEAMQLLHREKLRKERGTSNPVVVVSDGLATPQLGETSGETAARIRGSVRRLLRAGSSVTWVYPPARRGLRGWLAGIWRGLNVRRMEVAAAENDVHPGAAFVPAPTGR